MRQEIVRIIEESHPGCGQKRECYTHCGECGADRVINVFLGWLEKHGNHLQIELFKKDYAHLSERKDVKKIDEAVLS